MLLSIPVSSSMKMFNLWLSLDWWEEINESRNWKIGKFCTNWPHSSLLTFVDSLKVCDYCDSCSLLAANLLLQVN
ncbi:hypothetical protein HanIR_Chr12g0581731 [Helianthus annuus]|nr:hypothetical protein HanIR_Chr12g0581731 [Helianthus annuus]